MPLFVVSIKAWGASRKISISLSPDGVEHHIRGERTETTTTHAVRAAMVVISIEEPKSQRLSLVFIVVHVCEDGSQDTLAVVTVCRSAGSANTQTWKREGTQITQIINSRFNDV